MLGSPYASGLLRVPGGGGGSHHIRPQEWLWVALFCLPSPTGAVANARALLGGSAWGLLPPLQGPALSCEI